MTATPFPAVRRTVVNLRAASLTARTQSPPPQHPTEKGRDR
jgi:hypothetical protein